MDTTWLPGDFPRAIRQVLTTPTPVVQQAGGVIQGWYDHSLLLTQGTQELMVLATILCQRHEQWMEGLNQEFPTVRDQLGEMGIDVDLLVRILEGP